MRRDPTAAISDSALAMFVQWSRWNRPEITDTPGVARAVLRAYAIHCPDPEPAEVSA